MFYSVKSSKTNRTPSVFFLPMGKQQSRLCCIAFIVYLVQYEDRSKFGSVEKATRIYSTILHKSQLFTDIKEEETLESYAHFNHEGKLHYKSWERHETISPNRVMITNCLCDHINQYNLSCITHRGNGNSFVNP